MTTVSAVAVAGTAAISASAPASAIRVRRRFIPSPLVAPLVPGDHFSYVTPAQGPQLPCARVLEAPDLRARRPHRGRRTRRRADDVQDRDGQSRGDHGADPHGR